MSSAGTITTSSARDFLSRRCVSSTRRRARYRRNASFATATPIEHKLYWSAPASLAEARYLAAVLNSETGRSRAAAYQSRGQFGARDFDKVMFNLSIPRFHGGDRLHLDLAAAAQAAERIAAAVALPEGVKFQRARALARKALVDASLSQRIDALVAELLARTPQPSRGSLVPARRAG